MAALNVWSAAWSVLCAGIFALATPVETARATETNVLVIGKSGDPDLLDPAVTVTNDAWTATYPAYERLMRFKVENGKGSTDVEGELANSWKISPDGKVFTFTLNDGHKFADGSPVNAQAVKFSFERLLKIGKGPSEPFEQVAKVDAIDDHTVEFTLKEGFAPFLSTLVDDGGSIVSPEVMKHEANGDFGQAYLADHSLGSGAFQVTNWEKGQQIVMEPNPNFGGKKPAFKKIVIKIIKEASARRLQLEKGDLDIAEDIPIDQLKALKNAPGIKVVDEPSFLVTYLYLNNTRPPLDNPKVRQALSYAIDYKGVIDGILLGQAVQMRGAIPVGMWGHDPTVMQYSYDPAKAKELLTAAGVKDVKLGYLYAKRDPAWEQIGLVVQQELGALGIKVDLQEFAYPTMRDKLNKGDFDIAVGNWTPDYADPSMFMNFWFDSKLKGLPGDRAFYSNPKVDELIRKAAVTIDQGERTKLYQEAQRITTEEAPYILLCQRNYQFAMRDNIKGYVYNPMLLQIWNFDSMSKQ
ncbi:MAG: ABC transporter substrate-binding protein [Acidobacteriaceae bacterium]|nr:ABC transporter substrate-binding protein [Acidobacteriaceae bacterium]